MSNVLYIVPTPIGNMSDITLRALEVLRSVGVVACEDPRVTMRIFNFYNIKIPKLIQYTEHSSLETTERILSYLTTDTVALVSNAGVPMISDPGHDLVRIAAERNIKIVPLPGCSAVTTALSVSAIRNTRFIFLGFLPQRVSDKKKLIVECAATKFSLVIFENNRRLLSTVKLIADVLKNPYIEIARELTKMHESILRGGASEIADMLQDQAVKGEIVIIVDCSKIEPDRDVITSDDEIDNEIRSALKNEFGVKEIVQNIYSRVNKKVSKKLLYNRVLYIKNNI